MTEFENTPIVVGQAPTTYGELRHTCELALSMPTLDLASVLMSDPLRAASAYRGALNCLLSTLAALEAAMVVTE